MSNQTTTLGDMFRELNSFLPCSKNFAKADASGITFENNGTFSDAVQSWVRGYYDDDPVYLLQILEGLLDS
jgi:hypothetical protein